MESIARDGRSPSGWTDNLAWAIAIDRVTLALVKDECARQKKSITVYDASERPVMMEANRQARYQRERADAIADGNVDRVDKLDRQMQAGR